MARTKVTIRIPISKEERERMLQKSLQEIGSQKIEDLIRDLPGFDLKEMLKELNEFDLDAMLKDLNNRNWDVDLKCLSDSDIRETLADLDDVRRRDRVAFGRTDDVDDRKGAAAVGAFVVDREHDLHVVR